MSIQFCVFKNKETGQYARWWSESNEGGDFCVSTQFHINFDPYNNLWVVEEEDARSMMKKGSTEWFNAGYKTPTWEKDFADAVKNGQVVLEYFLLNN